MKEREIFQKPQPFDIGRVFDMLMTCINTSDKIAIIWSKKDGIIIHSKHHPLAGQPTEMASLVGAGHRGAEKVRKMGTKPGLVLFF